MLELVNKTPFPAALLPGTDKAGRDFLTVVVKGTFVLRPGLETPPPAEEQVPLLHADVPNGEPGRSSVRYEADFCPAKPATDVVLVGSAQPREKGARWVDVRLAVGPVSQTVRVFGDRRWVRQGGAWRVSDPEPFESVPLVYERAFGGVDDADPEPARRGWEPRNPVGTGFAASADARRLDGLALPNLEDPARPIQRWQDRPPPAGFGFIGRSWEPRVGLAGTYDDDWSRSRAPLLPLDFDERYWSGAHPLLTAAPHLRGDEPVALENASGAGPLLLRLPGRGCEVSWCVADSWSSAPAPLDTVLLSPEDERLTLTWKATLPCPRRLLFIDKVCIRGTG